MATTIKALADCRYFLFGTCTKGNACPFRHSLDARETNIVCPNFKAGGCFDINCTFRHCEDGKDRSVIPCYWETRPGGCQKPSCPFLHRGSGQQTAIVSEASTQVVPPPGTDSQAIARNGVGLAPARKSMAISPSRKPITTRLHQAPSDLPMSTQMPISATPHPSGQSKNISLLELRAKRFQDQTSSQKPRAILNQQKQKQLPSATSRLMMMPQQHAMMQQNPHQPQPRQDGVVPPSLALQEKRRMKFAKRKSNESLQKDNTNEHRIKQRKTSNTEFSTQAQNKQSLEPRSVVRSASTNSNTSASSKLTGKAEGAVKNTEKTTKKQLITPIKGPSSSSGETETKKKAKITPITSPSQTTTEKKKQAIQKITAPSNTAKQQQTAASVKNVNMSQPQTKAVPVAKKPPTATNKPASVKKTPKPTVTRNPSTKQPSTDVKVSTRTTTTPAPSSQNDSSAKQIPTEPSKIKAKTLIQEMARELESEPVMDDSLMEFESSVADDDDLDMLEKEYLLDD